MGKGFTLIELIVVLVIVGILAAVAIPIYSNAIEKKRGEACANNMRMILTAWQMYNLSSSIAYDPDKDPSTIFRNVSQINSPPPVGLNLYIDEKNFGDYYSAQKGFYLYYIPEEVYPRYYIFAYRLSGAYANKHIACNYYPKGNASGLYYVWSTDGPWKFENE
jgi:prepilin-type N-terminal cleavage/methylation domain-containing protein